MGCHLYLVDVSLTLQVLYFDAVLCHAEVAVHRVVLALRVARDLSVRNRVALRDRVEVSLFQTKGPRVVIEGSSDGPGPLTVREPSSPGTLCLESLYPRTGPDPFLVE